jgi:putative ABC transport system ATP-binding protein
MTHDAIIEAQNVVKTYGTGAVAVQALQGIDFAVNKGEFSAVVGPSGSGKTTLMNIIAGLDNPSSGTVLLNRKNLSRMSGKSLSDFRRDNIGFIFQAYNLIPVLTVEENVEYIMMLQKVTGEERHRRVSQILEKVGLRGFEKRKPPHLSGGQQQRVAIARAMVSNPQIIIADEPTANLDSKTGTALLDMMHELNEKNGMTFLFSTHDQKIMERAKRVVVLKDGRIDSDQQKE